MRSFKTTTRMSALVLALAGAACAQRSAVAQDAAPAAPAVEAVPAVPAAPAKPAPPETAAASSSPQEQEQQHRAAEEKRQLRDQQRALSDRAERIRREMSDLERANADLARAHADVAKFKDFPLMLRRGVAPDAPVIISTAGLEAPAQAELKEDMVVMDKLIRDEVIRAGADEPSVLGIKITLTGKTPPQYVEGAGAIFTTGFGWPLAAVEGAAAKAGEQPPRDPASRWDKVKRELSGQNQPKRKGEPEEPLVFDQAKVDQLQSALIKLLPEATNFRHLKENESVFITVTGTDDGGTPMRMTLKASKADIDAAAGGKITPEQFAQRVARGVSVDRGQGGAPARIAP